MITKVSNGPVILSTAGERLQFAAAAAATPMMASAAADANVKTPDYHLPYTGDQVNEALKKSLELDPNDVGGVKVLESTADNPYDIDGLVTPGSYIASFVAAATFPDEFIGITPIKLDVSTKPGSVIQVMEAGGNKYYRWSKDGGNVWSEFSPKSTNSGPIDTSGNPTDPPPPDPMIEVNEKFTSIDTKFTQVDQSITNINTDITGIKASLGAVISLGAADVGQKILNGTFDYDAQ